MNEEEKKKFFFFQIRTDAIDENDVIKSSFVHSLVFSP
jgi:hypothetical protein